MNKEDLLENPQIIELISDEIQSRVCAKRGFREFERVFRFKLLPKHFEAGVELSAKQSVKRHVVARDVRKGDRVTCSGQRSRQAARRLTAPYPFLFFSFRSSLLRMRMLPVPSCTKTSVPETRM